MTEVVKQNQRTNETDGNENYLRKCFLSPAFSFERLAKGAKWFDISETKVRVSSKELLIQIKNEITPLRQRMFQTCENFRD
jgi:hypothetical protein